MQPLPAPSLPSLLQNVLTALECKKIVNTFLDPQPSAAGNRQK